MPSAPRKPLTPPKPAVVAAPEPSVAAVDAAIAATPAPEAPVAAVQESAREIVDAAQVGVGEFQEIFRKSTESALEQTKAAYERMKTAAEESTGAIETTYARTTQGLAEISAKTVDVLKANADAQFDFFKSLLAAKDASEAFALQSAFARQQFEAIRDQFADLTAAAQRIAKDTAEPIKSTLGKTFSVAA